MFRIRHKHSKTLLEPFLNGVTYIFTTNKKAKDVIGSYRVVYDSTSTALDSAYINSSSVPNSDFLVPTDELEIVKVK